MTDETNNVQASGEGTLWLYKQSGLLLGPASFEEMVRQIESGELDGDTEACIQGQPNAFHPIREEPLFMVALAKAAARQKVEAQHRDVVQTRRKAIGIKGAILILLTLIGLIAIGAGARYLATNRPWERKIALPEPIITDELPVISLSSKKAPSEEEEGMAYPSERSSSETPSQVAQAGGKTRGSQPQRHASVAQSTKKHPGKTSPATSSRSTKPKERDGLSSQQEWDEAAIQQILATKKKTLHPCLTEEAHRQSEKNPTWSARIPLEFTVSNGGKVVKLWIDHYEYKSADSELYKCMFKTLTTWKFPPYSGEQANVSLAFNVQAR